MKIEEIPPIENVELEVKIAYGKINQLVDLVNSQQEAIGELQTEIGVLRNMVLQSQEAIEKLKEDIRPYIEDRIQASLKDGGNDE